MPTYIDCIHHLPESLMASSTSLGLLLLRLSLGLMYLAHAGLKLFVFTLPGTAQFFVGQGLPGGLAYAVVAAEIAGGALLLLGIYPRQVALVLTPIPAGAAWVHAPNGWVFNAPGGGWEYPVFLVAMSVVLWLAGDGAGALKRTARFTWNAA
ncbi:MAG: DoxX family protein [Burkholderiales bacterium]|nr:DoxX family protein [Burkholderiales bacterium]